MLIAEIQKRTRDHFVAAVTQVMLAASLWGHGMWIQAMGLPAKLEQDSSLHSQHREVRALDRPTYAMGDRVSMPAPQQPASSLITCYSAGAVNLEEPPLHLVAEQRYQF
jgi:hypothetical protein